MAGSVATVLPVLRVPDRLPCRGRQRPAICEWAAGREGVSPGGFAAAGGEAAWVDRRLNHPLNVISIRVNMLRTAALRLPIRPQSVPPYNPDMSASPRRNLPKTVPAGFGCVPHRMPWPRLRRARPLGRHRDPARPGLSEVPMRFAPVSAAPAGHTGQARSPRSLRWFVAAALLRPRYLRRLRARRACPHTSSGQSVAR